MGGVFVIETLSVIIQVAYFKMTGKRVFLMAPIHHHYELAIFCGALIGGSLGFLWFNTSPAQVFMGDVGSLALGGALGTIAVLIRQEFLLPIVGGIFMIEVLSVIIQVSYFKITGNRVFLMAPIHHHFEKLGWPEQKIVVRFWIVSAILGLVALSTLKLR